MSSPANPARGPQRDIVNRRVETSAPVRCACYGALSELVASPHDHDLRASLRDKIGIGADAEQLGIAAVGPALDALLEEFAGAAPERLKRDYSALFEVGNDGPPVPIREDLQTGQRAGTREDLVRFYNFFKYSLAEPFAWAPDHLSVELEFMHFLCFHEATVEADARSYQLAQFDFAERHLANWLPRLADAVADVSPGSLYARAVGVTRDFVSADREWQAATVAPAPAD